MSPFPCVYLYHKNDKRKLIHKFISMTNYSTTQGHGGLEPLPGDMYSNSFAFCQDPTLKFHHCVLRVSAERQTDCVLD